MYIYALDGGPKESHWLLYDPFSKTVLGFGTKENDSLFDGVEQTTKILVLERLQSFMIRAGTDVFNTHWESARLYERWKGPKTWLRRGDVKLHLCGRVTARDADVRAALIDRFGPGKTKAIGLKKNPGPLYGITKHHWSTLALAITYQDCPSGGKYGD